MPDYVAFMLLGVKFIYAYANLTAILYAQLVFIIILDLFFDTVNKIYIVNVILPCLYS